MDIRNIKIEETDRKWFAEKETFIEFSVDSLNLWIYEDGAHIRGPKVNMPFEAQDYENEDDLIRAFIEKVIFFLKQS